MKFIVNGSDYICCIYGDAGHECRHESARCKQVKLNTFEIPGADITRMPGSEVKGCNKFEFIGGNSKL